MLKYFSLALAHLKIGSASQMQYRANFFVQLLQTIIALGTGLIGLSLVFSYTSALAGWKPPELLAVMGVYTMMGGVIQTFIQPNMLRLQDEIREGTLDFALIKPLDGQLLISIREIGFWHLVDVLAGIIVLIVAILQMNNAIGILQALAFPVALLLGSIMLYCFWLMLTATAFWIIRAQNIIDLFQGVYAAGRWPVGIYPDWMRAGLTFLVPVAFAVTVPAEAISGRLTLLELIAAFGLTILLVLIARFVWLRGVRSYGSASS